MNYFSTLSEDEEKEFFRGSLLPASRYKDNGQSLLNHLLDMYMPMNEIPNGKLLFPDLSPTDFYIDSKQYFVLRDLTFEFKDEIMICFLDFVKAHSKVKAQSGERQLTRIDTSNYVTYDYIGVKYTTRRLILNSFYYYNVWITGDYINVVKDVISKVYREVPLYPLRGEADDGQMKIMTDAILALDAIPEKKHLKVLIVGSSHEPGIVPRSAYYPLFFMVSHSYFDLYDPYEESGTEILNTNTIVRHRALYDYTDMNKYDLILDDSWTSSGTRIEEYILTKGYKDISHDYPLNYSLKIFKPMINGRYYYQVGHTRSNETRLVTRPIIPFLNLNVQPKLGKCSFCRELIYNLQDIQYSDQFYAAIARCHKRSDGIILKGDTFFGWEKRNCRVRWRPLESVIDANNIRRLAGDYGPDVSQYPPVEMRREHLSGKNIVVSSEVHVTNVVVGYSARVLRIIGGKFEEAVSGFDYIWAVDESPAKENLIYYCADDHTGYKYWSMLADRIEIARRSTLVLKKKTQYYKLSPFDVIWFSRIICGPERLVKTFYGMEASKDYVSEAMEARKRNPHLLYTTTKMDRVGRNKFSYYVSNRNRELDYDDFNDYDEKVTIAQQERVNTIMAKRDVVVNKYRLKDSSSDCH